MTGRKRGRKTEITPEVVEEVTTPKSHRDVSFAELKGLAQNARGASLLYDIETRPAEESVLKQRFQTLVDRGKIKLPEHPGEFDPMDVKYGNAVKPEARKAKYKTAYEKHQAALNSFSKDRHTAMKEAYEELVAKSTLDPLLGRVLAIGYGLYHEGVLYVNLDIEDVDEAALLRRHWDLVRIVRRRNTKLVSYNGHKFDYPFCYRRSLAYEDVTPEHLLTKYRKLEDFCVDAAEHYTLGIWGDYCKLDDVCTLMGVDGKLEGMTGDMFWKVHLSDPKTARQYLTKDILALYGVSRRMNII
jgi:hypothetical protein